MATVLIIDDNDAFRTAAALALRKAGYTVHEAGDGTQGLAKIAETPVDVVVTDIVMPNTDGVQAITAIRQRFPDMPILAISGGDPHSAGYLKIAQMIGATRVLQKPFVPAVFMRTVAALVATRARPSSPESPDAQR